MGTWRDKWDVFWWLTQPQVLQDPESPNAAAQRQGLTHTVHVGVFGVQIPYETWTPGSWIGYSECFGLEVVVRAAYAREKGVKELEMVSLDTVRRDRVP